MGTGSGIQAVTAARRSQVRQVLAVDIDEEALEAARENAYFSSVQEKIMFRRSDLFSDVPEVFDCVIFNPPYLPSDPEEAYVEAARAWNGGPSGSETIRRFLREAESHVKMDGVILLVLSSLTAIGLEEIGSAYDVEVLEEEAFFFERIRCLQLRVRSSEKVLHI